MILIILQMVGNFQLKIDLAAAATVVDIGRHQPKLILATQPLGLTAW